MCLKLSQIKLVMTPLGLDAISNMHCSIHKHTDFLVFFCLDPQICYVHSIRQQVLRSQSTHGPVVQGWQEQNKTICSVHFALAAELGYI